MYEYIKIKMKINRNFKNITQIAIMRSEVHFDSKDTTNNTHFTDMSWILLGISFYKFIGNKIQFEPSMISIPSRECCCYYRQCTNNNYNHHDNTEVNEKLYNDDNDAKTKSMMIISYNGWPYICGCQRSVLSVK